MDHPTVAVIVRVYGPSGVGVPNAPIQAELSMDARYHGFTIPAQIKSKTDEHGLCVLRLWPNVLGDVSTEYKFIITNPDSGKRKIVYAQIPNHDVFLDDISSPNSGDWPDEQEGGGESGSALPDGGTDKQVLTKVGSANGVAAWQDLTIIVGTLVGKYLWETGVVVPPVDPGSSVFDSVILAAYQSAISGAANGSKRAAAASAIIAAMGSAQRLTLKRNGVSVLVASYTGTMTQTDNGTNIGITLPTTFTVGPISAADVSTGTWTGEITGGASYARTITLPISTDVSTAPGQGFNPTVNLIIPRSVDGL